MSFKQTMTPPKNLEEYKKSLVNEEEQTCLGLIKCYFENKILSYEQNFVWFFQNFHFFY